MKTLPKKNGCKAARPRRLTFAVALLAIIAQAALAGHAAADPPQESITEQSRTTPAPPSKNKTVIGAVHTDAVSAYLDDEQLVLQTKADIDVTGDGVPDLGSRLETETLLFHINDKARVELPNISAYSFLGAPGETVWLAPQTQNHDIIWPGFSTEAPELTDQVADDTLKVRLQKVEGPGRVEVYMADGVGVNRIFSSSEELPDWQIGIPQHTHMNWGFTKPGTYTLTFQMTGTVAGREQTAQNDYTFVVGEMAAHQQDTEITLKLTETEVEAGTPALLEATITPQEAVGAIQFRDLTSDIILGHAPLENGKANFKAASLVPGEHRLVAEFVPTWADDYKTGTSQETTLRVTGETLPKPQQEDQQTPTPAETPETGAGIAVQVTNIDKKLKNTDTLSLQISDRRQWGRWVSVWLPAAQSPWQGWQHADLAGRVALKLPENLAAGSLTVIVRADDGTPLGHDTFTLQEEKSPEESAPPPPAPPPPPPPAPVAAPASCAPQVILETGHIDAFYVAAGGGKAVMQLMEDVTGHHVLREAETVLLRVKEAAWRADIPAGTPGSPSGYVLPLTQNPHLIWPGWDTNRTAASGYTDVSINVTGVQGPGTVYLSSQGSFGDIKSLLTGGRLFFPGTIREAVPAHTHAQWVFTKKGIYKLHAHAVATNPGTGRSLRTAAHTYVFQVGDVPLGDAFCGLNATGTADAAHVNAIVNSQARRAVLAAKEVEAKKAAERLEKAKKKKALQKKRGQKKAVEDKPAIFEAARKVQPHVFIALIGGGALIVLGIVGGTVWYVRRLSQSAGNDGA